MLKAIRSLIQSNCCAILLMSKNNFVKPGKNCGGASMSFCSCQCDLIYTKNCNIFWSRQMAWGIKGSAQVVQNGVWSFLVTLISKINDPCNWVTLGYSKFEKFWLKESDYFFQKSFWLSRAARIAETLSAYWPIWTTTGSSPLLTGYF